MVLQHGGSFVDAAESFVRAALGDKRPPTGRSSGSERHEQL